MISKNSLWVSVLSVCISSLVACAADAPVMESQTGQTATSLAALGVMEASPDNGGYQLFGDAHQRLGRVIVRAPRSYIVELVDDVVEATWNDQRMDFACNGAAIALGMDSSNRWAHQGGASIAPTPGCLRALEVGRLLTPEARPETPNVAPKSEGKVCFSNSTWVWGTGNCQACLRNIPGGETTSCSDGWATTSCSTTRCYEDMEQTLQ